MLLVQVTETIFCRLCTYGKQMFCFEVCLSITDIRNMTEGQLMGLIVLYTILNNHVYNSYETRERKAVIGGALKCLYFLAKNELPHNYQICKIIRFGHYFGL